MRNILFTIICVSFVLSGCSSYTASGAMVGGQFGHVIGSAVGGISGGWRGHHMGSLIGTVGGAVAGAAIGAAVEQSSRPSSSQTDDGYEPRENRHQRAQAHDRYGQNNTYENRERGQNERRLGQNECSESESPLVLRHAAIYDSDHNGILTRGEECTVVFEVMNTTSSTIYDVYPIVEDVTGNRHVQVSPNLRVESISPNRGIRYTATILADKKLKDGEILVRVGVAHGKQMIDSQTQEFRIPTRKN